MNINDLVKKMIEEHKGGTAFFEALDENIKKNENLIEQLFSSLMMKTKYWVDDVIIIVSGEFGLHFNNYLIENNHTGSDVYIMIVNGNLRHGEIMSLEPFKDTIKNDKFIFFDDSFYKGRTRDKIKTELEKWGGELVTTVVCYDGSYDKDEDVHSLYRYYDNHDKIKQLHYEYIEQNDKDGEIYLNKEEDNYSLVLYHDTFSDEEINNKNFDELTTKLILGNKDDTLFLLESLKNKVRNS